MRRQLNDNLAEHRFGSHLTPITQRSGFYIYFPELPQDVPLNTVIDYENYLARLRAFGDYAEGHLELMRAGVAAGKVLPAVVFEGDFAAFTKFLREDPRFYAKTPEELLGEQFDIRAFHDVVLGSGAIPLDVLEANVNAWLKESR